jgi:hypothetical protein
MILNPGSTPAGALQVDANAQLVSGGLNADNVWLKGSTTTNPTTIKIDTSVAGNPQSFTNILFANGASTNVANIDIAPGRALTVTQSLGITSGVKLQTTNAGTLLVNGAKNAAGSTYTGGTLSINAGVVGGNGTIPAAVIVNTGGTISAGTSGTVLSSGTGLPDATANLTTAGSQTWTGGTGITGGTYAWKLNTNNAGVSGSLNSDKSGTNWDQLTMSSLTISASVTSQFNIEVIGLSGTGSAPFDATKSYSWAAANVSTAFTLPANAFHFNLANLSVPNLNPLGFSASEVADGPLSDLVINYTPVALTPEPTSLALLGCSAAGLLFRRRRRGSV